jgi:hypothetical protein
LDVGLCPRPPPRAFFRPGISGEDILIYFFYELETRKALLGHKSGDITTHYSGPELEELLQASNRVCGSESRKSPALVVLRKRVTSTAREKAFSINE